MRPEKMMNNWQIAISNDAAHADVEEFMLEYQGAKQSKYLGQVTAMVSVAIKFIA